ncbi:23S rRNA m(5)U-1939 methyltransferase [Cricetibacter osteomyelitidis]|uniref:23S rRNA (uracil(1939)-C(5))-methyltransferase RlmD n=1 Tax=Cricetibacter osteomyelitidis TaxID=1521931 RepID=A0A4R2SXK1_9PAST|nr:23S rRNA (uracil(1939)-C(5))-methyltransferase RlmD [Cricetibacter osteomyelitidis]TCP93376.1 23S rRNA m(5)U-1939 methyltransferase [Cricetibacter osteomyelitidis]
MALLYQQKKPAQKTSQNLTALVTDLDYQGLGITKINGKTWFIENALPGEQVQFKVLENKRQYGRGVTQKLLQRSAERVYPQCEYYTRCGGCQSQHIPLAIQREAKQAALFRRLQKLQPQGIEFMPMICGEQWHYRRRVRLSLLWNPKTKKPELGFRQANSQQIVPIEHCNVLAQPLNGLIPMLIAILNQWSQPKNLGHIELVNADNGVAMLLRTTGKISENDRTLLLNFAISQHLMLFVQQQDDIEHWHGEIPYYQIENLKLQFDIRDFIQVNRELNTQMVQTALQWLDLQPDDQVLDLFCGMGNFTLPLSRRVKSAVGIEGVLPMVEKARSNAHRNQCHNAAFYQADLAQSFNDQPWATRHFNKILLDPPRSGAAFALNALCELNADKILYVSCNPATLVRDAEILLNFGYKIQKVAMIDMFPNTGHLESVTLFSQ